MRQSQQPELLRELREKAVETQFKLEKVNASKKQNLAQVNTLKEDIEKYTKQKQIQERKYRSLIVLLNELQRTYHETYLEEKNNVEGDERMLILENQFIRNILIKESENVKEMQKLLAFLKQLQISKNTIKTKSKQFIKKSNYIQNQAQIIAKLKSQINLFRNQNLQCKRKWFQLEEENRSLQHDSKLLKVQIQRQKTQIREQYENYLDRINDSKTKIVNFNETQRQKVITDYFIEEIAILQQKRVQVEQKNQNLVYHFQNLNQQASQISMENKELMSFFNNNGQESKLATKMKCRTDQLRDTLIELKNRNKNSRTNKLSKVTDYLRGQLNRAHETNDFMEMRVREQEDAGVCLEDKPIAEFFTKVLEQKDKQLIILREQENGLKDKKKELQISKELLKNQISSLEENLDFNSYERKYKEESLFEKESLIPAILQKK